jgi:hypothetical protein
MDLFLSAHFIAENLQRRQPPLVLTAKRVEESIPFLARYFFCRHLLLLLKRSEAKECIQTPWASSGKDEVEKKKNGSRQLSRLHSPKKFVRAVLQKQEAGDDACNGGMTSRFQLIPIHDSYTPVGKVSGGSPVSQSGSRSSGVKATVSSK